MRVLLYLTGLANSYRSHNQRGTGPRLDRSGSGPVIVVQHAAQALTTLDLSRASKVAGFSTDELVPQSLMIALTVIMSNEVLYGCPQRLLAEEDHAIQTGLLDAAHKSFRDSIQIWRSRGQLHRLHSSFGYHAQKLSGEQWVAVVNQVPFSGQDSVLRIREIPGNLAHPQPVRRPSDPGNFPPCVWTSR